MLRKVLSLGPQNVVSLASPCSASTVSRVEACAEILVAIDLKDLAMRLGIWYLQQEKAFIVGILQSKMGFMPQICISILQ